MTYQINFIMVKNFIIGLITMVKMFIKVVVVAIMVVVVIIIIIIKVIIQKT